MLARRVAAATTAVTAAIALTRKPVARLIRASLARRARRRVPKPARAGGR